MLIYSSAAQVSKQIIITHIWIPKHLQENSFPSGLLLKQFVNAERSREVR